MQKKKTIEEIKRYLNALQNTEIDDVKLLRALRVLAEVYNAKIEDNEQSRNFTKN